MLRRGEAGGGGIRGVSVDRMIACYWIGNFLRNGLMINITQLNIMRRSVGACGYAAETLRGSLDSSGPGLAVQYFFRLSILFLDSSIDLMSEPPLSLYSLVFGTVLLHWVRMRGGSRENSVVVQFLWATVSFLVRACGVAVSAAALARCGSLLALTRSPMSSRLESMKTLEYPGEPS